MFQKMTIFADMKGIGRHILAAVFCCALLALSGCSAVKKAAVDRLKEIEITSFSVEGITPRGLKALDASFYVGIHNPTVKLELSDVTARLFYKDAELGSFVLEPFTIAGHEDRIYLLSGHAALSSASSLFQVAGALGGGSPDDFTVLISATGKGLGVKRDVSRSFRLKELIDMVKK